MTKITIATAVVLHEGWEMDNEAWVVEDEDDGSRMLWTTNHGSVCPMSIGEVEEHIKEAEESISQLKKLKALITGYED